jgi:hypothetical protein
MDSGSTVRPLALTPRPGAGSPLRVLWPGGLVHVFGRRTEDQLHVPSGREGLIGVMPPSWRILSMPRLLRYSGEYALLAMGLGCRVAAPFRD